ncbi:MAG: PDZ domain-containing protein [Verrucomicrobiaceae bacterium]
MRFRIPGCAVFAAALSPVIVSAQVLLTFPLSDDGGEAHAIALPVGGEIYATVGVAGVDLAKAKVGGDSFEFLAHDPQSRITLLKGPKTESAPNFGKAQGLKAGDALYLKSGKQGAASLVVSWETQFHDQHLPLSFLRIHHPGALPKPGQPLYDEKGALVAISHQPTPDFGNGTYALPIEAVERNLEDFKTHKALRRCWLGLHLDHLNPIPAVEGVRPESPSGKVGLQKGDVLLSLGGWPVTTYGTAINAFYYLIPEKTTSLRVIRGTQVLDLQVTPQAHPTYDAIKKAGE